MSVRFNGSDSNYLNRSSDILDANQPYTVMSWIYLTSDQDNYQNFWCLGYDSLDEHTEFLGTQVDGTTLRAYIGSPLGSESIGLVALSLQTWYHAAIVRNSQSSLTLYLDGSSVGTSTIDVSTRGAITLMSMGIYPLFGYIDAVDGRMAAFKAWSTNLSQAEVQQEMWYMMPIRTANLYNWTPFVDASTGTDFLDYSGNGRNWTETGSVTFEADPPIQWRRGRSRIFIPAAPAAERRWLFGAHLT